MFIFCYFRQEPHIYSFLTKFFGLSIQFSNSRSKNLRSLMPLFIKYPAGKCEEFNNSKYRVVPFIVNLLWKTLWLLHYTKELSEFFIHLICNCHFILYFKIWLFPVKKYKSVNTLGIFFDNLYAASSSFCVGFSWRKKIKLKKSKS